MGCNCCCIKTLDFCNRPVCGEIDFDIKAQANGVHTLVLCYLETQLTLSADLVIDDQVLFDISMLNENFQFTGNIFDPSGTKILIRKDDIDYDCVKFKTVMNVSV